MRQRVHESVGENRNESGIVRVGGQMERPCLLRNVLRWTQ